MKLFDDFEAVKFTSENLIFITHNGFLYYIYNPKDNFWRKYDNAGNDYITIANYPHTTKKELTDAMHGIFPEKETDFMRMCNPSQLSIKDMLSLLKEDYTETELIIDFYRRFIYRMEYMLKVGNEKGYDLISIMGS